MDKCVRAKRFVVGKTFMNAAAISQINIVQ